jgi:hypothetical protein
LRRRRDGTLANVRKLEDAPAPVLYGFIAVGLGLWFLDLWIHEPALARILVNGFGLFLAIYSWLILRKRRKPSGFA